MSYYSYATRTETEHYLFFKARSDVYYCHVDEFKSITAHIPLYLKMTWSWINYTYTNSNPRLTLKVLKTQVRTHTVIQTRKLIQLQTWHIPKTNLSEL